MTVLRRARGSLAIVLVGRWMVAINDASPPSRKKAIFLGLLMPLGSQGEVEDGKESGEIIFDVVSSFAIGYANAVVAVVIMIP